MVKLMIAIAIALMVSAAFAEDCQSEYMGLCSSQRKCCKPYVCWVDAKCDRPFEATVSVEILETRSVKATQYQVYDKCPDQRSREGEACQNDRDCCMPLDCKNNYCTEVEGYREVIAMLRGVLHFSQSNPDNPYSNWPDPKVNTLIFPQYVWLIAKFKSGGCPQIIGYKNVINAYEKCKRRTSLGKYRHWNPGSMWVVYIVAFITVYETGIFVVISFIFWSCKNKFKMQT